MMVKALVNLTCPPPELDTAPHRSAYAPMFGLSADSTCHLISAGRRIVQKRHQILLEEANEVAAHYLLCEGAVKLTKGLRDGREQVVALALQPTFLGSPIEQGYPFTVETLTDVTVIRYPVAVFAELRRTLPELNSILFEAANRQLNQAFERLTWLGQLTAREKVARFLLSLAPRSGDGLQEGERLWLPVRQCDIANYLGLSPETLSRIWARFRRERTIVQDEPGFVSIRSRDALEALVA